MKLCYFHAHWRNISSAKMKTYPLGEHEQGFDDGAYTKGKTWQEQKTNECYSWWIVVTMCETSQRGKKRLLHNPALWMIETLFVDEIDNYCHRYSTTPWKGLGFRLKNWDRWCTAIWPMTSSIECFLTNFHNYPPLPPPPPLFPLYE
jgi:hypothetical protein